MREDELKKIPAFESEEEEREFWSAHDSVEYVNWRYSAYPYKGCQHGCDFCYYRDESNRYARPAAMAAAQPFDTERNNVIQSSCTDRKIQSGVS